MKMCDLKKYSGVRAHNMFRYKIDSIIKLKFLKECYLVSIIGTYLWVIDNEMSRSDTKASQKTWNKQRACVVFRCMSVVNGGTLNNNP